MDNLCFLQSKDLVVPPSCQGAAAYIAWAKPSRACFAYNLHFEGLHATGVSCCCAILLSNLQGPSVAADTASVRFKIVFEKGQKKEDDKGDK